MCVEDDDVVNHHGDQHHHHLQLVVDPQEDRTRHQAQYTAVDEVLETINSVNNLPKCWTQYNYKFSAQNPKS